MTWAKTKTAALMVIAAIIAGSAAEPRKSAPATYPGNWIWAPDSSTLARVPNLFILQPTKLPATWTPWEMFGANRYIARGKTLKQLMTAVYSQKDSRLKLTFDASMPDSKYDCIVTPQNTNWWEQLRFEINQQFNLAERQVKPGTLLVEKIK